MAITGGPAKDFKFGGFTLTPTKDSDFEYEESGFNFESEPSPNGDTYETGTARIGMVKQECTFTLSKFNEFKRMQDGVKRSGVVTALNGDVVSINGIIQGELTLVGGKATVEIAGTVRIQ